MFFEEAQIFRLPKNMSVWGLCIQDVPGGKVSTLVGHSIGHSKQECVICTCVLHRTVSEI
jgi:hypothetical protein